MNKFEGPVDKKISETLKAFLPMLGFGLAILTFLVVIDRPHWFVLRPVSGAAVAMSKAAAPPNRDVASIDEQQHQHLDVLAESSSK